MNTEYYSHLLQDTGLEVGAGTAGSGLFCVNGAAKGAQLLEDVPLFSFPLPVRKSIYYQTQGNVQPFCFHCMKIIEDLSQACTCPHRTQLCYHVYCSQECRDRNWLGGHWISCFDWNRSNYGRLREMGSEKNTWSDLDVAEVLASLIAKTMLLAVNGISYDEATARVFGPYEGLFGTANPNLYKINLNTHFKRIKELFMGSKNKLNIIEDEIPQQILEAWISPEIHGFIMSLVAFNSMSINGTAIGVYSVLSKLNHSCEPNSNIVFTDGNTAILETERDIAPGEELFISYIDDSEPKEKREKELQEGWGFVCACPKCSRGE